MLGIPGENREKTMKNDSHTSTVNLCPNTLIEAKGLGLEF